MSNKLISRVAELLGWEIYGEVIGSPGRWYINSWQGASFIEVAAYAKAEMAKRAVKVSTQGGKWKHGMCGVCAIRMYCDYTGKKASEWHQFDPTDPVSEADAVLKAIIDALEGGE